MATSRRHLLYVVCMFACRCGIAADIDSTLGMQPPKDAVVLFNGTSFDQWEPFSFSGWLKDGKGVSGDVAWHLVDDHAMQVGLPGGKRGPSHWIRSKQAFGDYRLHLEFRLPPKGAGNSGLFFGPLYEIQIQNSAGKRRPSSTDCGGLYQIAAPRENAALPPEKWQTLDLEYKAAGVDGSGVRSEAKAARASVWLNGTLVHDNLKLSLRRNKYAAYPEERLSHIILQDHNDPVQFRNIWVVEKRAAKSRPAGKQSPN